MAIARRDPSRWRWPRNSGRPHGHRPRRPAEAQTPAQKPPAQRLLREGARRPRPWARSWSPARPPPRCRLPSTARVTASRTTCRPRPAPSPMRCAISPRCRWTCWGMSSLRGDPNVTILVDGKPSSLFEGDNKGQALQSLQASTIERVEVITNPSAEFRADGSGGVINLIAPRRPRARASPARCAPRWETGASLQWRRNLRLQRQQAVGGGRSEPAPRHPEIQAKRPTNGCCSTRRAGPIAVRTEGLQRLYRQFRCGGPHQPRLRPDRRAAGSGWRATPT